MAAPLAPLTAARLGSGLGLLASVRYYGAILFHFPFPTHGAGSAPPHLHVSRSVRHLAATDVSEPQTDSESGTATVKKGRIYHETYGCQMNVNDMEIVLSIMKKEGYNDIVPDPESAEIIFINTCAIRDNAEQKVWQLNYFWFLKRQWKTNVAGGRSKSLRPPKIAVLGCMAERLKEKILDSDKMVDVVCGPDAYRDLPRLLQEVDYGQKGINTLLSLEETYADITPVRISDNSILALSVSYEGEVTPVSSVVREVGELWYAGVKEVMLLGQNVNSYNDTSEVEELEPGKNWQLSEGFSSRCKVKNTGLRFADLLDQLSLEYPEMRFRHNICKLIHLPAQSGSTELVQKIRNVIPDVGLSSDFISGFCEETEDDHADTLSLVRAVGYDMAYMFAYSMRENPCSSEL
ncbi:hypothetical protein ZWY2020_052079 [Hordeum vulgare]|nr:hypothetical protein ZWY2020_052079 [Hordeum vulgare]